MDNEGIAIVGIGKGGLAFLRVLLNIPDINIKYVCDVNPNSPGMMYAASHNIKCVTNIDPILNDHEVTLIFEATGRKSVFQELQQKKSPETSLVGSKGTKAIFSFIDSYDEVNKNLRSYKLNLEKRIIERTEELEAANLELQKEKDIADKLYLRQQEISEEKTKYLLHATHQLKAPFAAIQSFLDIILEGYAGEINEETKNILLKINTRSKLLTTVINEMLELAKLKTFSKDDVSMESNDLSDILSYVIEHFAVVAKSKNITINFQKPEAPLLVFCDKKQINALFSILIENALNYSPDNTTIDIELVEMANDRVCFEIRDQGIGMAEDVQDRIFEEYFRTNNAVSFMPNGTGLGLAIASQIAKIHHTHINVNSKINEGSTFSIIFNKSI
ncbi:MAG: HAMP domain-containing sensor histidine kinase [Thermodesulfobacteriota bacterium]|jgi:signal transduction histidine kinase